MWFQAPRSLQQTSPANWNMPMQLRQAPPRCTRPGPFALVTFGDGLASSDCLRPWFAWTQTYPVMGMDDCSPALRRQALRSGFVAGGQRVRASRAADLNVPGPNQGRSNAPASIAAPVTVRAANESGSTYCWAGSSAKPSGLVPGSVPTSTQGEVARRW